MAEARPDKFSAIVFSGGFEKVHYALVLASGAAAIGIPATLFFTMEATRALVRPDGDGHPAWRSLPAAGEVSGGEVDDRFGERGLATFEELLAACVAMRVRFLVCEMGLLALGLDRRSLRADVPVEEGGVVTFLNDASAGGVMLFI